VNKPIEGDARGAVSAPNSLPLLEAVLARMDSRADASVPRPEYPRPQFARERDWMNLNGRWEFEMDFGRSGEARGLQAASRLSGAISLPFCPESKLSGIGHTDFIPAAWYRRTVALPPDWIGRRILLHIGACDYRAWIYVGGVLAGIHTGGYTPFVCDITDCIGYGATEAAIAIRAEDDVRSFAQAKGKQSHEFASQGCDYTRTTGIWQTVWLESVPCSYLADARMTPQPSAGGLLVEVRLAGDPVEGCRVRLRAHASGKLAGEVLLPASSRAVGAFLGVSETRLWSCDDPFLYDLVLTLEDASGAPIDTVHSYFGLRTVDIVGPAIQINGKPVFQRLVLDQGFYPDGIYTAPTEDALRADIAMSREMGFNGARLHQKVFEPRYLYWCDRLGYIVWGEAPDWGLDVSRAEGTAGFLQSWIEELRRDFNHPSIVGWCPFNEHESKHAPETFRAVYAVTKALDPTRPVIDSSGWTHVATDVYDVHDYDQNPVSFAARYAFLETGEGEPYRNQPAASFGGEWRKGQPYMVSEYGGIWWNPKAAQGDSGWGYGESPQTEAEFLARYKGLTEALLNNAMMAGFCYTQLTDVEQEVNGLYTYDRRPKFDPKTIRAINAQTAAIERTEL
jgi:beta-galactosidase/beta-glucuronidase